MRGDSATRALSDCWAATDACRVTYACSTHCCLGHIFCVAMSTKTPEPYTAYAKLRHAALTNLRDTSCHSKHHSATGQSRQRLTCRCALSEPMLSDRPCCPLSTAGSDRSPGLGDPGIKCCPEPDRRSWLMWKRKPASPGSCSPESPAPCRWPFCSSPLDPSNACCTAHSYAERYSKGAGVSPAQALYAAPNALFNTSGIP